MSEYFLADRKAEERARTKDPKAEDIKVTLLGDFLFPAQEPLGCDPYNSTQGSPAREAWSTRRRDRR